MIPAAILFAEIKQLVIEHNDRQSAHGRVSSWRRKLMGDVDTENDALMWQIRDNLFRFTDLIVQVPDPDTGEFTSEVAYGTEPYIMVTSKQTTNSRGRPFWPVTLYDLEREKKLSIMRHGVQSIALKEVRLNASDLECARADHAKAWRSAGMQRAIQF